MNSIEDFLLDLVKEKHLVNEIIQMKTQLETQYVRLKIDNLWYMCLFRRNDNIVIELHLCIVVDSIVVDKIVSSKTIYTSIYTDFDLNLLSIYEDSKNLIELLKFLIVDILTYSNSARPEKITYYLIHAARHYLIENKDDNIFNLFNKSEIEEEIIKTFNYYLNEDIIEGSILYDLINNCKRMEFNNKGDNNTVIKFIKNIISKNPLFFTQLSKYDKDIYWKMIEDVAYIPYTSHKDDDCYNFIGVLYNLDIDQHFIWRKCSRCNLVCSYEILTNCECCGDLMCFDCNDD